MKTVGKKKNKQQPYVLYKKSPLIMTQSTEMEEDIQ